MTASGWFVLTTLFAATAFISTWFILVLLVFALLAVVADA